MALGAALLHECNLAFWCQAVLLEAAVGFVGDGHFDHCRLQQAFDLLVKFAGNGSMTQ